MKDNTQIRTLSKREKEVLQLVSDGYNNAEIALDLCISINTVKVHMQHIFKKSGVQGCTEAAMCWVQQEQRECSADELSERKKEVLELVTQGRPRFKESSMKQVAKMTADKTGIYPARCLVII